MGTAWRLSIGNTITPGQTVRHGYWWPTIDPYNGQTIGNWTGPQQALATPEQLLTGSNQVKTVSQGFQVGNAGNVYTVDVGCEDVFSDEFGSYEVWVQGMLP